MKIWLTNGQVAWQIPSGRISRYYEDGYYKPPAGWKVTGRLPESVCKPGPHARRQKEVLEVYEMAF